MEEKSAGKKVLTASILCSLFFILEIFNHNIDVYFNGINYIIWMVLTLVLFLAVAVFFIKSIRRSIKKRKHSTLKIHVPAILYTVTLILCAAVPGSEHFESDAVIVAGYQGKQDETVIKFRKNSTFEINSTAVFGYNEWFTGTYSKKGDTLRLAYDKSAPARIGKTLLKNKNQLITIDKTSDTTRRFIPLKILKETK